MDCMDQETAPAKATETRTDQARDLRVPFGDLRAAVERALLQLGLAPERAGLSARLIAETDRDGVRTHGIARLPRFAELVRLGTIDPQAEPECVKAFSALG